MIRKAATLGLAFALMAGPMFANEGDIPKGVPHLDHVFVIMMENHAYGQIIGNPNAPFPTSTRSRPTPRIIISPWPIRA